MARVGCAAACNTLDAIDLPNDSKLLAAAAACKYTSGATVLDASVMRLLKSCCRVCLSHKRYHETCSAERETHKTVRAEFSRTDTERKSVRFAVRTVLALRNKPHRSHEPLGVGASVVPTSQRQPGAAATDLLGCRSEAGTAAHVRVTAENPPGCPAPSLDWPTCLSVCISTRMTHWPQRRPRMPTARRSFS